LKSQLVSSDSSDIYLQSSNQFSFQATTKALKSILNIYLCTFNLLTFYNCT